MASLAKGRLKGKEQELQKALDGMVSSHTRFMLSVQLAHVDTLDEAIENLSDEIEARNRPFEQALQRLQNIPGVGERTAELIVAEIAIDMSRFASHKHLASWAGL